MDRQRLKTEVLSLQFGWFLSHVSVVANTLLYLLSFLWLTDAATHYGFALKSAIVGFIIILFKSHPVRGHHFEQWTISIAIIVTERI